MDTMEALRCVCGGNIILAPDGKSGRCEFCGTEYREQVLKAVMSGAVKVEGPVEMVMGDSQKERTAKNAETYIMLGEYEKAKDAYGQMISDFPDDYRGWWGLCSMEFTKFINDRDYNADGQSEDSLIDGKYLDNALRLSPDKTPFTEFFERFIEAHGESPRLNAAAAEVYSDLADRCCRVQPQISVFSRWLLFSADGVFEKLGDAGLKEFLKQFKIRYVNAVAAGGLKPERPFYVGFWGNYFPDFALIASRPFMSCVMGLLASNKVKVSATQYGEITFPNGAGRDVYLPHNANTAVIGRWLICSGEAILFPQAITKEAFFRAGGLCTRCGGTFKGVFTKVCTACGAKKEY